ncbi:hypothetical protein [Pseudomonas aeruginosa]|uniref:hypothetical protein n=1 Tax=Pseudomonas aeruginosa TaxID=287 RepID=UPI000B4523C9|nr:hypothetical protein [Pseudomonas aeruginosa]MBG4648883.1 hypothetical protein [Pseudomonas aeruginosa]MBG4648952.1 hypothetical protein [Pseudomonas aeruginosa]MBG4760931.1 hypothetical protein [Pseudomonas aeruginosa]MBG6848542.1 hypothetical protein [Pseudomonas aeruginosa]MCS8345363.1 hypothetical protein [Pseudomonas aeruginosa]
MNKANECTCPSGDGSLRHPCPAHPAVEQAGTNVGHGHVFPRADGVKMRCGGPGLCSECSADAARARAALAQPSPAGEYGDAYQGAREDIAIWKRRALEAEQALRQAHNGQTFMGEPLVQPYEAPREKVNALFKVLGFSGTASVGDILDAALERLQAQPSPAQAEQAEAERPEGPTEDELEAAGLGYPLHKEEAVKLWYSGFRSEVITVLEAWEAIGHDIGMNPDKGELLDSLRYMLEKCEAHDAALARVAELERQQPVAWMHDQPNRVDVIHRDVKDLLQRVPGSSRGIHRPLDVSEHYTIPLYAAPVAQAQHSVPEVSGIGRDFAYPRSVVLYLRTEPTDDDLRAIHDGLRSLAAAPGKEVPQAWLDVQAERRRQITAEGWTPDHDDLYCAAELPRAAAAYILSGANDEAPAIWPFSAKWWKPRDARANYMRAGALILAEIERLDRAAAAGKEVGHE